MSDKASIFLRFNLFDEAYDETIKGIMGNHYRGFDPVGLITRAMYGALGFVEGRRYVRFKSNYKDFEQSDIYQSYRRAFDVDFIHRSLSVSEDSTAWIKEQYRNGEVSKQEAGHEFFWCDADFGQIVFDVTGSLKGECKLKYAIVENLHLLFRTVEDDHFEIKIMSIREYMSEYKKCFEEYYEMENECYELIETFEETAEIMSMEELVEYFDTSLEEYLNLNGEN